MRGRQTEWGKERKLAMRLSMRGRDFELTFSEGIVPRLRVVCINEMAAIIRYCGFTEERKINRSEVGRGSGMGPDTCLPRYICLASNPQPYP